MGSLWARNKYPASHFMTSTNKRVNPEQPLLQYVSVCRTRSPIKPGSPSTVIFPTFLVTPTYATASGGHLTIAFSITSPARPTIDLILSNYHHIFRCAGARQSEVNDWNFIVGMREVGRGCGLFSRSTREL